MGVFSTLFKSRDRPQNSVAGRSWLPWLGRTSSGKAVTERSALQITAVYACVRLLAEAVATMPLHTFRINQEGGREKATEHPLFWILHDEPNPEMTSFVFRETLMTHLLLWGNAYAQIIRDGMGRVVALYPLLPNRMTVDRDSDGVLFYEYTLRTDEREDAKNETIRFRPWEILHIPALGFDGLIGYSPIAMAKNAIGLAMAAEDYGAKFFAEGGTPKSIITVPSMVKDRAKLEADLNRGFSSGKNFAVLEKGTDYKSVSLNPQDVQFIETRKFQLDEIARIFRVPPHMIGDLEKSSFSNIENMSREFVTYTLNPWISRWEQTINRTLFNERERHVMFVKFNTESLLRGDYKSRMEGYSIGRQNGWMNANDIRKLEDMDLIPDKEGGNLYLVNGNMVQVKDAGAAYQKAGSSSEGGDDTM